MTYLLRHILDDAAQRLGDKQAVCSDTGALTYGQLEVRSNQLARMLVALGVQPSDRVGIYLGKSVESVVAVYGILKAGAAYVPLDPWAPAPRLQFVIRDCGIRHLVTHAAKRRRLGELLPGTGLRHLIGVRDDGDLGIDCRDWDAVADEAGTPPPVRLTEQALAYILYTSGTTGRPKGMMHTHRSGLTFVDWAVRTYGLQPDDRVSNHAPLHFDLSIFDLFAAGKVGATTCLVPEEIMKMPASLSQWIESQQITVWYSVPVALTQLLLRGVLDRRDLSSLRWVLFGGEPFPVENLRRWMAHAPHARFSHVYGVTELNVSHFYHVPGIPGEDGEAIPIGRLCDNMEALVLDEDDRPAFPGTTGELVLRGPAMMRGYWNRPELDETAYYDRTVAPGVHDRFYRTGDLVVQSADGNYRFMGRRDRQVKIRGHRLEIDEIEAALASHTGVEEAAVWAAPDGEGSLQLRAAAKLKVPDALTADALIQFLQQRLPAYAIPARLQVLAELPRTSAGKIDRRQLESAAV